MTLGLLFDLFIYGKLPELGWSLYIFATVSGIAILIAWLKRSISKSAIWFLVLSVVFAAGLTWRASYELSFLNVMLSLILLLLAAAEITGQSIKTFVIERYASLIWLPLYFLANIGPFFVSWLTARKNKDQRTTSSIFRGILLTLPVLIVFILLFSSADLVFHKYVKSIIDLNISPAVLVRTMLVIIISLGFCGAFWYVDTRQPNTPAAKTDNQPDRANGFGRTEVLILLGSVNALFLLFIVIQLAYLFGGQHNITAQGFTYAQYARRGFLELIAAAAFSWLIVWAIDKTFARSETALRRNLMFLNTALVLQVFVIMASSFMRLVLYEQAYGFTTMRLYSHLFIIWLAVVFILLMVKSYRHHGEAALAWSILLSILIFAGLTNLINPDAFIARKNVDRYQRTGKIDISYLNQLSPDAIPSDPSFRSLRPAWVRHIGVDIGVEAVFVGGNIFPERLWLRIYQLDLDDCLDTFKTVLPRHHQSEGGAVLWRQRVPVQAGDEQCQVVHGFV